MQTADTGDAAGSKGDGEHVTVAAAVDAYLADRDLAPNSRRTYTTTFDALADTVGADTDIADISAEILHRFIDERWGQSAPATYNARVTAIGSLLHYCARRGWTKHRADIERRRVPRDDSKAISYDDLVALWNRPDVDLREKLLWQMLYSTAARSRELLALNIEDLDLGRKRAVVTGKGGHREWVVWDAATARLLRRYLNRRSSGPLFVGHTMPKIEPADDDRAPDGRARLSYQQTWKLFHHATDGKYSLHQLRHSALTHLGEAKTPLPLLMAKSRHLDPRTLTRYCQPGVEAVARLTAEHDPTRRTTP